MRTCWCEHPKDIQRPEELSIVTSLEEKRGMKEKGRVNKWEKPSPPVPCIDCLPEEKRSLKYPLLR